MIFKKLFKWLFIKKKIKTDNYINMDCSDGSHLIILTIKEYMSDQQLDYIVKELDKIKIENVRFAILDGVQLDKVVHICDHTIRMEAK